MPYPIEHAARLHDPAGYDRFRRENDKFGSGIHAIWGIKNNKAELQAIRFDAGKFTAAEARAWLKDHDYQPILFEPATGKEDMTGSPVCKYVFNTITASASDKNLPSCTITTINQDREGDRVIPEGGDFSAFMKSPVLMWAHGGADRYAALPIGTVTALEVQPGQGIRASWKWLEDDPFADRIKNAWDQGVVRASSIGFKPVQAVPNGHGMDHERWELIELSLCAVPMNPEAVRTLKSLGLMDEPTTLFGPDGNPITKVAEPKNAESDKVLPNSLEPSTPIEREYVAALSAAQINSVLKVFCEKNDFGIATRDVIDSARKSGRVLSAVNESRLRAALTALADANGVLSEVLSQLVTAPAEEPEKPAVEEPVKPEDEPLQFIFDDEPTVLRLTLDESEDEAFCTIVDDQGREAMFLVDPSVVRLVIADTVKEHLQHSLIEPVGQMVQQALDQARGRVH